MPKEALRECIVKKIIHGITEAEAEERYRSRKKTIKLVNAYKDHLAEVHKGKEEGQATKSKEY